MRIYFALFFSVASIACTSSSSSKPSGPAQACLDTADAAAKGAMRCGQDYKTNYDAFIQTAAKGNCANIISVRDEAALRGTCIPSFATISCADYAAGNLDASCHAQLVHPAAFTPTLAPAADRFETIGVVGAD